MFLTFYTLVIAATCQAAQKEPKLIWEDNFDALDETKWTHLVSGFRGNIGLSGNNEFQYYRNDRRNSYVEDGVLKVKPTLVSDELSDYEIRNGYQNLPGCNLEPCTVIADPDGDCILPIYSARLHTQNLFAVKYGRIEARAKLPSGDWLWPAIWLMPNENTYGGWPTSGEIDIMESTGNKHLKNGEGQSVSANMVGHTLHWGPRWPYNRYPLTHWEVTLLDGYYSDDFHTYELEWTSDYIAYKIDGVETGRVVPPAGGFWELGNFSSSHNPWESGNIMAPFDQPFYLILNVAVGGTFFGDDYIHETYPRPWNWSDGHPLTDFYEGSHLYFPTWDQPALEIDYIRVFEV